jgi:hypothetical protein
MSETSEEEIPSRDSIIEIPENSYGYYLFDKEYIENDGEVLEGEKKNISPTFYIGTMETYEEICKRNLPGESILRENMKSNGWFKVVRTKFGNVYSLEEGDIVL